MRRRGKKLLVAFLAICAIAIIGYFVVCAIIQRRVAEKLNSAVASRLDADLQYDSLSYRFPYTVELQNVRLFNDNARGHGLLLGIKTLNLTLVKIPRSAEPIVVKNLELIAPT